MITARASDALCPALKSARSLASRSGMVVVAVIAARFVAPRAPRARPECLPPVLPADPRASRDRWYARSRHERSRDGDGLAAYGRVTRCRARWAWTTPPGAAPTASRRAP